MNKIIALFITLFTSIPSFAIIQDDFVNATLSDNNTEKPVSIINYDYQNTDIVPIKLQIMQNIKTEKDLYEGQIIKFIISQDVFYKGKLIAKHGTPVTAKVETIITNGMNGIPASIILNNFNIPNLNKNLISPPFEKYGLDLSLLVFPIKWALTILPPTGSLM